MKSLYLAYSVFTVLLPAVAVAQNPSGAMPYQNSAGCRYCGHRKALVIGNDRYDAAPLKNAVNDAVGMSERLTKLGFETTVANDIDLPKMEYAIEQFVVALNPGDIGMFFFSGHGFQIDGENYLVPVGFNATTDAEAKNAAYPMSRVVDSMSNRKTSLNIVVVDACRNFPFAHSRSLQRGLAPMSTGLSSFIAFSTAPGMTADDNPSGSNGLFTKNLLAELDTNASVPIDDLFTRVRKDVYAESAGAQVPWVASSVMDGFAFSGVEAPEHGISASLPPPDESSTPAGTAQRGGVNNSVPGSAPATDPQNELSKTEAEGSRAINSNPQDAAAYMVRARARLHLGRFEDAISDLSHALAIKPDLVEAYRERGRLYLVINRAAQAEEDLSLSLNSDANDFLALYYRSLANVLLKREDVAIQDATNLIQVAPSFPEAYLGRASAYLLQGKPEEAIRDCSDALRLDPELSAALSLRGKALQAIGKSAEAQRDFSYASLAKRRALIGASLQAK
jgi:uncharacterized caspase-like protein